MTQSPLFTTSRLLVRKLETTDLPGFYALQSSKEVMRYVTGIVKTKEGITLELQELIKKYNIPNNDFWIFAVLLKEDDTFIGTCAFVKDANNDDEIGYRLIPSYWHRGLGTELCEGMITFAPQMGCTQLMGYVADDNPHSARILERCGFIKHQKRIDPQLGLPETIYKKVL